MLCEKGVLKDSTKFTGKHPCQSLFFNKVAGLRLWHRCFPVTCEIFKNTYFYRTPPVAASVVNVCLLIVTFCSLLFAYCSSQFTRYALVSTRYSLLSACYLLFSAHCFLRFTRYSFMIFSFFFENKLYSGLSLIQLSLIRTSP